MGLQRMSEKTVRKMNQLTAADREARGIGEFVKVGVMSDPDWAEGVTADDEHWTISRKARRIIEKVDGHWSSCGETEAEVEA